MNWIIEKLKHERIHRNKMLGTTPPTNWEGSQETWDLKEQDAIKDLIRAEKILKEANELTAEVDTSKANLTIPVVMQWVAIEDELPKNDKQVFVQWDNGRFGINEYWESDKCWKYNFDGMNIKYWCEIKPPCA